METMPDIPESPTLRATPRYNRKGRYMPLELATHQFDPDSLTVHQITTELKYYKDAKQYR